MKLIPPKIRKILSGIDLGEIHFFGDFEPSPFIKRLNKPISIISCFSDRTRTTCLSTSQHIIVIHNTYITSFFDNIALFSLVDQYFKSSASVEMDSLPELVRGLARKFVAEQLYVISPSDMARRLILENLIDYDDKFRILFKIRDELPILCESSHAFTRLAADFSLHHEIGHSAIADEQFHMFIKDAVGEHINNSKSNKIGFDIDPVWFEREAYADIFSLNCCLTKYCKIFTENNLREYLKFLVRLFSAVNTLYLFAEDLHIINNDPTHFRFRDLDQMLLGLAHRESLMYSYVTDFVFSTDTVTCQTTDAYLTLKERDDIFLAVTNAESFTNCKKDHTRRVANLINEGFRTSAGFDAIIHNSRQFRNLE